MERCKVMKAPDQILRDLYDELLRECIPMWYCVHATDSKKAIAAAKAAADKEYKDMTEQFNRALDNFQNAIEGKI
jgi:hypothetical protein